MTDVFNDIFLKDMSHLYLKDNVVLTYPSSTIVAMINKCHT